MGVLPLLMLVIANALFVQTTRDSKNGESLYIEKCVLCHGSQGEGWDWTKKAEPPIPVPDLRKSVARRSDEYLFEVVKYGGEAVGKTRLMPPFGFQLTDNEVWDLVAYLRGLER